MVREIKEPARSDAFWDRFVARTWEKRPCRIAGAQRKPLATPAEIFSALLGMRASFEAGSSPAPPRVYIEHALQQADVGRYLPLPADRSLEGYSRRMTKLARGRPFCLVVDRYQVHDAETWLRLLSFLHPLYARVGVPAGWSDVVLFVGKYESTPSGIHQDAASNFTFVLTGRKRILAWPDRVFRNRPAGWSSVDYAAHRAASVQLDGEAGDVLYWPASYWHVGESPRDLSITLSVTIYRGTPYAALAARAVNLVDEALAAPAGGAVAFRQRSARRPNSAALLRALGRIRGTLKGLASDPKLVHTLRAAWVSRVTARGFEPVPDPLAARRLADTEVIRGNPRLPIAWASNGRHRLICSANGHAFAIPADTSMLALLKRLNRGEPGRVGDLVNRYAATNGSGAASRKRIRALLEGLCSLRAIQRVQHG